MHITSRSELFHKIYKNASMPKKWYFSKLYDYLHVKELILAAKYLGIYNLGDSDILIVIRIIGT